MKFRLALILLILGFCMMGKIALAQHIDFMQYSRYLSPPIEANYIGSASGNIPYVEKLLFKNITFDGQEAIELETLSGPIAPETKTSSTIIRFDDDSLFILASTAFTATLGTIELKTDTPMKFPRFIMPGESFTEVREANIKLGPIPAKVSVSVTFGFLELETVELPSGVFTDALKVEAIRAISLSGVELLAQKRFEWYHPTAGIVQYQDTVTFNSAQIDSTTPPLDFGSHVDEWAIHQ